MCKKETVEFTIRGRIYVLTVFLAVLSACVACTRTVYVPLQQVVVREDSVARTVFSKDTVLSRDSVGTEMRGDTLVRTVVRYRREVSVLRDTLLRTVRDTLYAERLPEGVPGVAVTAADSSHRLAGRYVYFLALFAAVAVLVAFIFMKKGGGIWRR